MDAAGLQNGKHAYDHFKRAFGTNSNEHFRANAESAEAVARAVARLLDDPALRTGLGAAGRRAVESHFNWDRVTRELVQLGHELGAGARQTAAP